MGNANKFEVCRGRLHRFIDTKEQSAKLGNFSRTQAAAGGPRELWSSEQGPGDGFGRRTSDGRGEGRAG